MRLLSLARDLQRRKGRERRSLFVAEGIRTVEELLRSELSIRGVLVTPQLAESARGSALSEEFSRRGAPVESVTETELSSAADTDSPQGVIAIAEIPDHNVEALGVSGRAPLVVLDGVQDPGNAGTILRTAAALGAAGVVALPGTVDLWNPKVVRGAMGAHFRVAPVQATVEQLIALLDAGSVELWGTAMDGEPVGSRNRPEKLAVALGNEGAGLTEPVRARCDRMISVPIEAGVESLNVAVAAGIILHELRR